MGETWKIGQRVAVGQVVIVDTRGQARVVVAQATGAALRRARVALWRSGQAVAAVKAGAAVPEACGDAIPLSPARGSVTTFDPVELVPDAKGGYRRQSAGYLGRSGAMVEDVWDRMDRQARAAHARLVQEHDRARRAGTVAKDKAAPVYEPLFTPGQVATGRDYAALTERCAASGVSCSSLEAQHRSASGGGDREAAVFRDFARLRAYHRRIGDGLAKEVRRIRPGGSRRRAIRVRALVDMVCLGDRALLEVLEAHGWAKDARALVALRASLSGALDRMQGYRGDLVQDVG